MLTKEDDIYTHKRQSRVEVSRESYWMDRMSRLIRYRDDFYIKDWCHISYYRNCNSHLGILYFGGWIEMLDQIVKGENYKHIVVVTCRSHKENVCVTSQKVMEVK